MVKPKYYIASFSGGKDSTAMVLRLIELDYQLDEVVCCDTTMEFPAMYRHIEKVRQVVEAAGIKFTILQEGHDFEYYMLRYQPKRKNPQLIDKMGFSWPGPQARWCTATLKTRVIGKYIKSLQALYDVKQYIGIAADEGYRLDREHNQVENHLHPLVDWGWDEAKALSYCYDHGYDWEGLYEIFSRVSCWCCPIQGIGELRKLWKHFPELWEHMNQLDKQTWRTFLKDGWSVEKLDKRFRFEAKLAECGYSTKDRKFYTDLRRHCFDDVPVEAILKERIAS